MSKNNGLIFHTHVIDFVSNAWLRFDENIIFFYKKRESI